MKQSRLNGKRAVPLLRCSTMEQAGTSIDDQLNSIRTFATQMGMELAEPVRLAGKSGSIKRNLDAMVDEVIARKLAGERIEIVVYFDQSRFGRSGGIHFGHLADRLANEGIGLAETDGYIEDKGTADLVRIIKAEAAKRHAMSISDSSARGSESSLLAGRRSHSTRSAFGIDKLYISPAGEERVIIRRFRDGSSVAIDPKTGELGERFAPGVKGYRKSSLEVDTLVPGDPALREIIIRIYRMHLEDGFGGVRIARTLNDEGVASPTGGLWSKPTIESILRNEVYTGVGYANRRSNAIYCNRAPGLPRPIEDSQGKLVRGIRPIDDWHLIEYSRLEDFLPADLKPKVMAAHAEYRSRIASGRIQDPKRANGRLRYLLSGLMTERTTGKPLKAKPSGDSSRTYYCLSGGTSTLPSGSPLRRRLAAPPLEKAILEEIESLLCSLPDLQQMIRDGIAEQDRRRQGDSEETTGLLKEREKLNRRYQSQLDLLGGSDDGAIRDAIQRTRQRIAAIDDRLASIDSGPSLTAEEVGSVAAGVIEDMRRLLERLAEGGDQALRSVVEAVIGSAVADLEAGEVEFKLVAPAEFIQQRVKGLGRCRRPATMRQDHKWEPVRLDGVTVELPSRCGKGCWQPFQPQGCEECRRQRRAA